MVVFRWHVLVLALWSSLALAERPKLVVLTLTGSGADAAQLSSVTERVTAVLAERNVFDLISARDVETLLGVERQRQLVGCTESNCMTELSGAIGARFVLSGTLVKLGEAWQLTITTLDTQRALPVGRAVRLGDSLPSLFIGLPQLVAQATGLPPPPGPSRALPVVLLGVGAASIVTGTVIGLLALTQEAALQGELSTGSLATLESYRQRAQQPALLKSVALGTLLGGAAFALAGVLLWPWGLGDAQARLVPMPNGLALVGVWP